MERKHQDEIALLKFVKKDNFDVDILITVVECCECWCNGANKFLPILLCNYALSYIFILYFCVDS